MVSGHIVSSARLRVVVSSCCADLNLKPAKRHETARIIRHEHSGTPACGETVRICAVIILCKKVETDAPLEG